MTMTRGLGGIVTDPQIEPRVRRALARLTNPNLLITDLGVTIDDHGKIALRLVVGSGLTQDANGLTSTNRRVVSTISTATTAGAAGNTHYIYLVSGTTTLTLPTAAGNTCLYTVKQVGSNTVTIATTASQTIDGSQPITLTVTNTSLDIVSDNANWKII